MDTSNAPPVVTVVVVYLSCGETVAAARLHAAVKAAAAAVGGVVEGYLPPRHHVSTQQTTAAAWESVNGVDKSNVDDAGTTGGGDSWGSEAVDSMNHGGSVPAAGVLVVGPGAASAAAVAAVEGVWGVSLMPPSLKLAPVLTRWHSAVDKEGRGKCECVDESQDGGVMRGCGGDGCAGEDASSRGGSNKTLRSTPPVPAWDVMLEAILLSSSPPGTIFTRGDEESWSTVATHVAAAANAAGRERRGRCGALTWTATTSTDAAVIIVTAPCQAAAVSAAIWLAARPEVVWVQLHAPRGVFTNQYSRATVAGGAVKNPPTVPQPIDPPLWQADIKGSGEVVGIGDTGVDMQSCFFNDPYVSIPGPFHRKVVMYRSTDTGNKRDDHGHGTHCAGIIAGSPSNPSTSSAVNPDSGLAPEAKLAVTDLDEGLDDEMVIPPSMKDYYAHAWDVGARVHSDSWGQTTSEYTVASRQVDDVVSTVMSGLVPVFPSGNGGVGRNGWEASTVMAPSNAKSALSVGASMSADTTAAKTIGRLGTVYSLTAAASATDEGGDTGGGWGGAPWPPIRALAAKFGVAVGSNGPPGPWTLRVAVPMDGCGPAPSTVTGGTGAGNRGLFAMLLVRGQCPFIDKVRFAQQAGAVAAVVVNNKANGYVVMSSSSTHSPPITIPAVFISRRDGALLAMAVERAAAAATASGGNSSPFVTVRLVLSPAPSILPREDHVADFSGMGPMHDGRVKPDLVAPGEVVMSASAGIEGGGATCALVHKTGTSQAAPLVAAAAALARQYFKEGRHWAGGTSAGNAVGFQPSGALVRAVLINGAHPLTGYTTAGSPLERAPSGSQGFGRLDLVASLPLVNPNDPQPSPSTPAPRRLYVRDMGRRASGAGAGDVLLRVCLRTAAKVDTTSDAAPLRFTLAWADPPPLPAAAKQLVADLDLLVVDGGSGAVWAPNGGTGRDNVNTIERVLMGGRAVPKAWIGVEVKASAAIPGGVPGFALAVEGPWDVGVVEGAECGACVINTGPPQVTRDSSVTIDFGPAQTAGASPNRVMCRLSGAGGGAGAPAGAVVRTHGWRHCGPGPATYHGLPDGAYTFSVRCVSDGSAAAVPAAVRFDIDSTPPGAFIRPDPALSPDAAARHDYGAPLILGKLNDLQVHFSSRNDVLAPGTVFECRLRLAAASPHQSSEANAAGNGRWSTNCVSPYVYRHLPEGSYVFEVRGGDAAGNWDPVAMGNGGVGEVSEGGTERSVSVEVHWGGVQTRVINTAVRANLTSGEARFSVVACGGHTGVSCTNNILSGTTNGIAFRCGLSTNGVPYAWQDCGTDGGKVVYEGLSDGIYWFVVRAIGDETAAVVRFIIDRLRPVANITSAPRAVNGGADVPGTFFFTVRSREGENVGTSDAVADVTAECCVVGGSSGTASRCGWSRCSSPHAIPQGLEDGDYAFFVRAISASGVPGDPTPAAVFTVDSMAPVVTVLGVTTDNAVGMVCVSFTASDNSSLCHGDGHAAPDSDGDGRGCGVSCKAAGEHDWKPCISPACYAPALVVAPPGSTSADTGDAPTGPNSATEVANPSTPAGALGRCSAGTLWFEVLAVDAAGNRAEASIKVQCGGMTEGSSSSLLDRLPVSPKVSIGIIGGIAGVIVVALLWKCRTRTMKEERSSNLAASFSHSHISPVYEIRGGRGARGTGRGLLLPPARPGRVKTSKTPSTKRLITDSKSPSSPRAHERSRIETSLAIVIGVEGGDPSATDSRL